MPEETPIPPVTETTTEKHETTVTKGDAAQSAAVSTNPRFDDWVRAILAVAVVAGFEFIVIYGQVYNKPPDPSTINTITGFMMLSLGFYLGSSYGSNLKDKAKL